MNSCICGRPVHQMLLHPTGRVVTSLISLRGWSEVALPHAHGHAARWRAGKCVVPAAVSSEGGGLQQAQQRPNNPVETFPTTAFGKVRLPPCTIDDTNHLLKSAKR